MDDSVVTIWLVLAVATLILAVAFALALTWIMYFQLRVSTRRLNEIQRQQGRKLLTQAMIIDKLLVDYRSRMDPEQYAEFVQKIKRLEHPVEALEMKFESKI